MPVLLASQGSALISLRGSRGSQESGVSGPPSFGRLCESETHSESKRARELSSEIRLGRRGSAVKAVFSLVRSCPRVSVAPVFGDCEDGGGVVLKKATARPRWRDCVGFADRAEPRSQTGRTA